MAEGDFKTRVAPGLEKDLIDQAKLDEAIKLGQTKTKYIKMAASGSTPLVSQNASTFEDGKRLAMANLVAKGGEYIKRAAAERRMAIYGE
jgi:hypothetical protein